MAKPPGPLKSSVPPRSLGEKVVDFLTSPQLVLMTLAGLILVFAVPYIAFRTIPGASDVFATEPEPVDPNPGMDFSIVQNLPPGLAENAAQILASQEPRTPEPLIDVPEASGFGLIYPVSEIVEPLRPALSWTMYAPPPYSVVLKNAANQVIARVEALPNLNWLVPMPLERGATYSWEVTGANRDIETASFIVMDAESAAEWQAVRREYQNLPLVLGLVAEQLGMLSVAEREYQALIKAFPNAEAPARLLANVQALRDDSSATEPQEVF